MYLQVSPYRTMRISLPHCPGIRKGTYIPRVTKKYPYPPPPTSTTILRPVALPGSLELQSPASTISAVAGWSKPLRNCMANVQFRDFPSLVMLCKNWVCIELKVAGWQFLNWGPQQGPIGRSLGIESLRAYFDVQSTRS